MISRILSLIVFICVILAYLIMPFFVVQTYITPPEKKALFEEARKWKEEEPKALAKLETAKKKILQDPSLSEEEKRLQMIILEKKWRESDSFFRRGKEFHSRLLKMGVTLDVPILIGIYFVVGILLFWLYRRRAKRAGVLSGKLQYTLYLFILSCLIIITTFGFGFTAIYIYNPSLWQLQHPIEQFSAPLQETPFIATHFILYALNVAAMGPFDHYMTVRPNSLYISLMQWLERLFVISVLFSSISRLWWRTYEEGEEGDPTMI